MEGALNDDAKLPARAIGAIAFLFAGGGYPLLLALTFFMDARRVFALALYKAGENADLLSLPDHINYLVIAEWLCVIDLARTLDWTSIRAHRFERAAGLAFALYASLFVAPMSHVLTALLGLAIALKLWTNQPLRGLALCIALISLQDAQSHGIFGLSLNGLCASLDAYATHYFLEASGYANELVGNSIRLDGLTHSVGVISSCATTVTLFEVLAAFGVFALWQRADIDSRFYLRAAVLAVAVFQANWLRIAVVAMSKSNYDYWHDGGGKPLISLAFVVLAFVLARSAARESEARRAAAAA